MIKKNNFKTNIVLISLLPLLLVSILLMFLSYYQSNELEELNAKEFSDLMLELKRSELKNYTEVSLTTIRSHFSDVGGANNRVAQVTDNIVNSVDVIGDEFFFVYDYDNIIHDLEQSVGYIENKIVNNTASTFYITALVVFVFTLMMAVLVNRLLIFQGRLADDKLKMASKRSFELQEQEKLAAAKHIRNHVNDKLIRLQGFLRPSYDANKVSKRDLKVSIALLDSVLLELNKISYQLRPEELEKYGLIESIKNFLLRTNSDDNIEYSFKHSGKLSDLSSDMEISLYKIIQEAVTNAVKHSRSSIVIVRLSRSKNAVKLIVQDKGEGFSFAEELIDTDEYSGIADMKIRVESLGGDFSVFSGVDVGTVVRIDLPIQ